MTSQNVMALSPGGTIATDNEAMTFLVLVVYSDEQQFEFLEVTEVRRVGDGSYHLIQSNDSVIEIRANSYRYIQISSVWSDS